MTLPKITPKQQQILILLYTYRFLTTKQIQLLLNHKDKKTINLWLKDLRDKDYLAWNYSRKFGENTKPAIYYFSLNGIRFLKKHNEYPTAVIQTLYKDGQRTEEFIQQCIFVAEICLQLGKSNTDTSKSSFSYVTRSEYQKEDSPFFFLTESPIKPALCFFKQINNKKTHYLLNIFESTLPLYMVRKRIREYLEFYQSSEWENKIGKPFPIILFICPSKTSLIYAKSFTKKLLEENQNPEDLQIRFTTIDEVKTFGITEEIWEEV